MFVTDDQSPDDSCCGNEVVQTPSMDALTRDTTLFANAIATTASCSASRFVILTGLHSHSNGQYGYLHNYHKFISHPRVQSLPVLLKRQGYRTARIGKCHVGPDEVFPFDEQFKIDARNPVFMVEQCRVLLAEKSESPFSLLFATACPHRDGGFASGHVYQPDRFGKITLLTG